MLSERLTLKQSAHNTGTDDDTWELQRLMAIEIDGGDDIKLKPLSKDHPLEVEVEELFLRGVESEAREIEPRSTSLHALHFFSVVRSL